MWEDADMQSVILYLRGNRHLNVPGEIRTVLAMDKWHRKHNTRNWFPVKLEWWGYIVTCSWYARCAMFSVQPWKLYIYIAQTTLHSYSCWSFFGHICWVIVYVECERPAANTWRRKIDMFCKLEEKPCVENRRKPSDYQKKNWFNQKKNAKTVELCDSNFWHVFTKKMVSLQDICSCSSYLWLVLALVYLTLAFAGAGVPASSYCDGREAAGVVMMGALLL